MEKEYKFSCVVEQMVRGYVTAKNEEEAKQKILNDNYDDIADTYNMVMKKVIILYLKVMKGRVMKNCFMISLLISMNFSSHWLKGIV